MENKRILVRLRTQTELDLFVKEYAIPNKITNGIIGNVMRNPSTCNIEWLNNYHNNTGSPFGVEFLIGGASHIEWCYLNYSGWDIVDCIHEDVYSFLGTKHESLLYL